MGGDQCCDTTLQGLPQVLRRRRRALDRGCDPVTPSTDGGLHLLEELAGAHELLPPGKHLAAQEGAVGHARDHVITRPVEFLVHGGEERCTRRLLGMAGLGKGLGPARQGPDGSLEGLTDHDRACPAVIGQGIEPALEPRHGLRRQEAFRGERRLGDGEDGRGREALLTEHGHQMGANLVDRVRRDTVEDDRDSGPPLGGGPEQIPWHGIGIARSRGDEEPEVGRGEQLAGQLTVGGDNGVDVRRVEKGHARG